MSTVVSGLTTLPADKLAVLRNGLRIMALHALGETDTADDVVQETLARAMVAVTSEIAADEARLGAYVGGIARNVIAETRRVRARAHESAIPAIPVSPAPDQLAAMIAREAADAVRAGLQKLSREDQRLLHTCFYDGLTPREAARMLQESPTNIRKRKSRALARLREVLQSRFAATNE